jgi:DNA-binding SARP family transcriptional activator/transposase
LLVLYLVLVGSYLDKYAKWYTIFPHMYIRPKVRLEIVQYYLNNKNTLMQTALKFHVNYRTVHKWVKLYEKEGKTRLLGIYKKPWNRTKMGLEVRIALLKERDPALTTREAKEILEKQGIKISIKGIWAIWKRYGYMGFKKEAFSIEFPTYFADTPESRYGLKKAESFVKQDDFHRAGKTLNELPSCPKDAVLENIPGQYLSLRRKLEKFYALFGSIPYTLLSQNLIKLRKNFEREGYLYSALRAGLLEALSYAGSGKIEKELALFAHLRKIYQEEKLDPALRFSFYCIKGIVHIRNLSVSKSVIFLRKCERLIKKYPTSNFILNLLIFYDNLGHYRKIDHILKLYEKKLDEENVLFLKSRLYITQGKYIDYKTLIRKLEKKDKKINPLYVLQKAQYLLLEMGDIYRAMNQLQFFLKIVKKMELRIYWGFASFFLAVLYAAQGEEKKARNLLKKYSPLMKKFGNKKDMLLYEIILNQPRVSRDIKKINQHYLLLLLKKSCLSLKISDYKKAYQYAEKETLLGILHRVSILFPEIIRFLIEKGKPTGLPRAILRLPVFNKEIPVYHIKFLGDFRVYKNQEYLKTKLHPKDAAFLIYLCFKATERAKLNEIYTNFWARSNNPGRNLSHLLVRVKKALQIPSHLLIISSKRGYPSLINEGIHFRTDYQEFEQTLAQAKALERGGEWGYAKKEYLHAFRLFRGEPFRKMYDPWSEQMRRVILNKLETETVNFAKSCLEQGNKKDARKRLQKLLIIIPNSEEINHMLNAI